MRLYLAPCSPLSAVMYDLNGICLVALVCIDIIPTEVVKRGETSENQGIVEVHA